MKDKTPPPSPRQCSHKTSHVQQVGEETLRICNSCKAVVSSVRPVKKGK